MSDTQMMTFEYLCQTIREVSDCMDDFLYVYDLVNDRYYISPTALHRFAIREALFTNVGETHKDFVYQKDYEMLMQDLNKIVDGEVDDHNLVYRWLDKEKKPVWINCRGKSIRDENGKPLFLVGCINELGRYPVADEVSGLLTSVVIKDFFDSSNSAATMGFMMCISIDDLHHINELGGKMNEVSVIRDVVDCINREKSDSQMVYRLLKDQFVIIDYQSGTLQQAKELFARIQSAVEQKIEQDDYQILYTISAGIISETDTKKLSYDTMLNVAQFILEKMREQGGATIYCYEEEDYIEFLSKRRLLADLRKVMLNDFDRFEVFFQPIVNGVDRRIYASESLLRFYRKDGTIVSPVQFIPLLESSGLIVPIGKWVLYQALAFCKKCRETVPDFMVGVNFSYIQVLKSNIVETIEKALKEFELPPECLVVELTESGHLENSLVVEKVWAELKKLGVLIALDDFGTGYSNLSSIGILLPHTIKLDREFMVKAVKNVYEHQLMRHIIELTHSLDLKVCIEGIENEKELSIAREMNVDAYQGFYFGKPCQKHVFFKQFIDK